WPTHARESGRLARLVREHACHDIAGLADVQGIVGTAEDVDVVHGQTTMASSSTATQWVLRLVPPSRTALGRHSLRITIRPKSRARHERAVWLAAGGPGWEEVLRLGRVTP